MSSPVDFPSFVSRDNKGNFQLQAEGLLSRKVGGWEGGRKSWYPSNIIGAIATFFNITQKVQDEDKIYYIWSEDLFNWANENKQFLRDRYSVKDAPEEKFVEMAISGVQAKIKADKNNPELIAKKAEAKKLKEFEQGLTNWVNAESNEYAKNDRREAQKLILECYKNQKTTLNLRGSLNKLPPEIGQLTSLEELNISHCGLKTIPAEIGRLTNLKLIVLASNPLRELSPEIGLLTNLEELDLNGCNILGTVPPEMGQLKNLQKLNMSYTYTTNLKDVIGELTGLKILKLHHAQIGDLSAIGNLMSLEELMIGQSDVKELPAEFGNLTNLKTFHFFQGPLYDSLPISVSKGGSLNFETPEEFKTWFSEYHEARRFEEFKLELKKEMKIEGEVDSSSVSGQVFDRIVNTYKEKSDELLLAFEATSEVPSVISSMPDLKKLCINEDQNKHLHQTLRDKLQIEVLKFE